jgi:hypothetical protein
VAAVVECRVRVAAIEDDRAGMPGRDPADEAEDDDGRGPSRQLAVADPPE